MGYYADARRTKLFEQFRASKAIERLMDGHHLVGAEREIHDELERQHPTSTVNSAWFPWEAVAVAARAGNAMLMARAETVGAGSAGGYLTASDLHPAVAALYKTTVVLQLGAECEPNQTGNYVRPVQPATATAYWLGTETTQINSGNSSGQTFSQASGTPHGVGCYTECSRQLIVQSAPTGILDVVGFDLTTLVSRAIDLACMTGTGTNGQPVGILNLGGITTFSGSTFSLGSAMGAVGAIGDALDDSAGWAANRTAAIALRQRLEFSGAGSRALWEDSVLSGALAGLPARSTSALASGSLIFGAWRHLRIPIWGPGLELSVNPYTGFQSGIVGVRALCYTDAVVDYQSAFAATSTFS